MHDNLETKYEHTLSDLIILCGDETEMFSVEIRE